MPTLRESKYIRGYEIEENEGTIVGIRSSFSNWWIRVGDEVVSNGRFAAPQGTRGSVITIFEPYGPKSDATRARTCDVIEVLWEGDDSPCDMKFKDLIPPWVARPNPHSPSTRPTKNIHL